MASSTRWSICFISPKNPTTKSINHHPQFSIYKPISTPSSSSSSSSLTISGVSSSTTCFTPRRKLSRIACKSASTIFTGTTHYEFTDGSTDVELRLELNGHDVQSSRDVFVDTDENSLTIRIQRPGYNKTLMETTCLYDKIKPSETIWFIDDEQLVVNLKKNDPDLKWPDIIETWESLTAGVLQILQGTSIYLVGDSTEINQKIARELAVGLKYTPLNTKDLLETFAKQSIESWVVDEGLDSVAEAESLILENLSSHVRAVVATLGGEHGASRRGDKWQHIYAGFSVWLSQSEATDEDSAKEEVKNHIQTGGTSYSNADVVVKLAGWDPTYAKTVAQASLSAIKRLILSDKKLPGKKSLYIRLGCRGDWPNIKPPGWDPCSERG
ncbi:probable inactive shikimate kinase like 2, chloroplastic [Impatiens glandulifera]|uniref:probable inactive shikimate kinase like 2, chloroplastic n=1 Tax=Impatiens glandulifera TaxID=253017 RepID=UPI001FB10B33|nr:probable inactive shikimate kinase like 2, chloroplastic [Impatiens glandulifera]